MCKKDKVLHDRDIDSILRDINQLDEKVYVIFGRFKERKPAIEVTDILKEYCENKELK